ncbi:MAG: hypothetical protein JO105_03805 [Hyphomicrobiales bacterium]|nr:hypothetical protein [Hyphomicrobiales bacterium]
MAFPDPVPGLVIRYSYLWLKEHRRDQEEGGKNRPCAIILVVENDGEYKVTVLPISHTPPADPNLAVEIPPPAKRRLNLDDERSWVVLTEANRFTWPGPDLRPFTSGDPTSVCHGPLPFALFNEIRTKLVAAIRAKRVSLVARSP